MVIDVNNITDNKTEVTPSIIGTEIAHNSIEDNISVMASIVRMATDVDTTIVSTMGPLLTPYGPTLDPLWTHSGFPSYIILIPTLFVVIITIVGFVMGSIGVHRGLVRKRSDHLYGIVSVVGLILCLSFPVIGPLIAIIGGTLVVSHQKGKIKQ